MLGKLNKDFQFCEELNDSGRNIIRIIDHFLVGFKAHLIRWTPHLVLLTGLLLMATWAIAPNTVTLLNRHNKLLPSSYLYTHRLVCLSSPAEKLPFLQWLIICSETNNQSMGRE